MPPVLAIVFWIWLLVSIAVLVRRRATKRTAARIEARAEEASPTHDTVGDEQPDVAVDERVPAAVAATPDVAPAAPTAPLPPDPPPGFEQPAAPVVSRIPTRAVPGAGIADALVGIRMPCDLVPLVVDRLATDKITLSTTGHDAGDVGTALADEIERLGYVLQPISEREVLATRGATHLRLTIRPPTGDGLHPEHPTAREDSVVVEIALG